MARRVDGHPLRSTTLFYVYGIVPRALDIRAAPPGIDGEPVTVVGAGAVAALVSELPPDTYDPQRLESLVADVAWLAPRAIAHDTVASWASEHGGSIPFPMWVLFRDTASVRNHLEPRSAEYAEVIDRVALGREYAVRVFGLDDQLGPRLTELSPAVARLEAEIAQATPGQRYLLERKLAGLRSAELREATAKIATTIHSELTHVSAGNFQGTLPRREDGANAAAILNGAYLVRRDAFEPFQARLTDLMRRFTPLGFRFEFTGPWPPYHFVQ